MKATNSTPSTKAPKSITVRELIPWVIVVVMVFSIAGLVSGWFIRSNVAADKEQAVAAVASKGQSR